MAKAAGRLQLIAVLLCVLLSVGTSERRSQRFSERAQQCRLERLNTQQPSTRIESEGGVTEIWDSKEDQFQCAGVAALRNVLQPNSLALPRFHPAPQLVYVEKGEGLMGLSFPGCPETFHSHRSSSSSGRRGGARRGERREEEGEGEAPFPMSQERDIDLHQKIHRVRRGDIVAIPAGTVHWWYNDGNEELIDVVVTDLNNQVNQLDQTFRSFELAGGMPEGQRGMRGEREEEFQNVLSAFDKELLAESFNVPEEIVQRMQRQDQQRGLIVRAENMRGVITPDEGEEEEECRRTRGRGSTFSPRQRRGSRWWEPRQEEGEEEGYSTRERGSRSSRRTHQLRPREEEEEGYETRERGSRSPRRTREEEEEEQYGPRTERGSRSPRRTREEEEEEQYGPRRERGSRSPRRTREEEEEEQYGPRRERGSRSPRRTREEEEEEQYGPRRERGSRYSPRERRGSRWWEPRRQEEEAEEEYGPSRERGSRYTPRTHGQTTREERQEEEYEPRRGERGTPYSTRGSRRTKSCRVCCEEEQQDSNGLEETICTAKIRHNLNTRKDVDVYTHRAGRLNVVNEHKLPILRYIDMSAEKANIAPNALYSPHWSINSHTVVYVTRGQADVQIVGPSNGRQTMMDERVSEGDMFVVPQFFLSTCRAGRDGFEFVSFKTTSSPMKSPLAGYTSVFRAMPLQVISNAYQISPSDAQELKHGREGQSFFLSPLRRSRRSN